MLKENAIKTATKFIIPALVFLILFPVYSRGVWELVFGLKKFFPYVMQFTAILAGISVLFFAKGNKLNPLEKDVSFWMLLFFFTVQIVSAVLTLSKAMYIQEVLIFCFIISFLLSVFMAGSLFSLKDTGRLNTLIRVLFIIGLINFIAAVLEQTAGALNWVTLEHYKKINWMSSIFNSGGFYMPFNLNIIRPTGITGSFLHFPLVMPLIGALTIRFEKNRVFKMIGFLFILIPFTSMSRSGMVIAFFILIALAIYGSRAFYHFIRQDIKKRYGYIIAAAAALLTIILIAVFVPAVNKIAGLIWLRVSDIGDMANTSRFKTWASHIGTYLKTNLVFGEYSGFSTNIVSNILGYNRLGEKNLFLGGVPESGLLSILVSFGMAGVLSYYGIFIVQIIKLFRKKELLLGFALLGAAVQTLFYQSVEVLPFMFTLALIPLCANSASPTDRKEQNAITTGELKP